MSKISVIVPVYKVEKYLNRCVDSILNQTFKDFELILVDDGSPDNCPVICDEYASKYDFVHVIHKENGGLSDARNAGIDWAFKNSDSEWITFIDSDDWIHKQYLEILYNACINNNVQMSSCGFEKLISYVPDSIMPNDIEIKIDSPEQLREYHYAYNEYNIIISTCRLYNKTLWENRRFPLVKIYEDQWISYKLLYACDKIAVIGANLYYYFENENSITHVVVTPKEISNLLNSFKEKIEFFYKNKFFITFKSTFSYYCTKVEQYKREYKNKPEFKRVLIDQTIFIKKSLKEYYVFLPEDIKKQGYRKWAKAPYLQQFKKDLSNIRNEKGFLYSILWAVKNYWKI